jgi:hypothetical protein
VGRVAAATRASGGGSAGGTAGLQQAPLPDRLRDEIRHDRVPVGREVDVLLEEEASPLLAWQRTQGAGHVRQVHAAGAILQSLEEGLEDRLHVVPEVVIRGERHDQHRRGRGFAEPLPEDRL